jgi:hypothetical protein
MRRGKPHPALTDFRIIKEFGWTKKQLDRQPAKFVEACVVILNEMDRQTEAEMEKAKRESRRRVR